MAVDMNRLESVRRAYERARVRYALAVSAPLMGLGLLVLLLDQRPLVVLGLTGVLFLVDAAFVWRGQQFGRGALAGLAGGAIPLVFGLCMQIGQRWWGAFALTPSCVAVCASGGVLAGFLIAWLARRQPSPLAFVFAAGTTALLMGTVGCACAGLAGVAGLIGGLVVPLVIVRVPGSLRQA